MESFDVVELDKRINSEHNVLNRFKRGSTLSNFNNRTGPKNLSNDSKELIGTLGRLDKQKEVAKVFGVSQALVSDYTNGFNGSGKEAVFDGELKKNIDSNINDIRKRIGDLALTKLERVINSMSEDKINETNLVGLSVAATNLGKLGSVGQSENVNQNTFHFYAPRNKNEDDYEIVDVV